MAADNDQARQVEMLEQQIEKLSREFAGMTAAFAAARRTRLLLMLVVLIFVCAVCYAFYNFARGFGTAQYQDDLAKSAQKHFEANQDRYMKQVELLVKNTSPAVTDAFREQANKDTPHFAKLLQHEQEKIMKVVDTQVGPQLKKRYEEALVKHDKLFRDEFPTATNEMHERMMVNLKLALDDIMEKHYVNELKARLDDFFNTWEKMPAARSPKPGDPSLPDQFFEELRHLMVIKFSGASSSAPAAPVPPVTPKK
jgi:hypothetical protein